MPVGIVHLARKVNGLEPYSTFIDSLRRARPTGDWRLVLVFKGFAEGEASEYLERVADLPIQALYVPDAGIDISAYFAAVKQTEYDPLVFFNSFSKIVEPRWYELFATAFAEPGVGLVGATGSLESVVRNHIEYGRNARSLLDKARNYTIATGLRPLFPPFPNPHVRTNAFMIRREHFLATNKFPVTRKLAAWIYESGWFGLTRQIQARGLRVVVVDRDGGVLPPEAWPHARVFRSGDQDKVIVEDNRVREYANAAPDRKAMLRWLAFAQRV